MMNAVWLAFIVLAAFTVQSVTGFGGALLAMPVAILLVGIEDARVVLSAISGLTGMLVAIANRRYISIKKLFRIIAVMAVGIGLGLWLDAYGERRRLMLLYGALIIGIALMNLFWKKRARRLPQPAQLFVLLLAGVMHGLFVSGGAFLMIYAQQAFADKNEFRATSCAVWGIVNLFMLLFYWKSGALSAGSLRLTAVCAAAALLSVWLAEKLQKKLDQERFLFVTNLLLLCTGALMLING